MPMDSTGQQIAVGHRVLFRGRQYTIKGFGPGRKAKVYFEESQTEHTHEVATEMSVTRVKVMWGKAGD